MIPNLSKGIPSKTLNDLVVVVKRGLSSYYLQKEGNEFPFINIRDVKDGRVNAATVEIVHVKETGALDKSKLELNDVIVSIKGSTFKAAIVDESINGFVISANLIAFKLNNDILPEIVVAYLNSTKGQGEMQARSAGAVQKALNLKSLMGIAIPVPEKKKQVIISEYLNLFKEYNSLSEKEQRIRQGINKKIISNLLGGI